MQAKNHKIFNLHQIKILFSENQILESLLCNKCLILYQFERFLVIIKITSDHIYHSFLVIKKNHTIYEIYVLRFVLFLLSPYSVKFPSSQTKPTNSKHPKPSLKNKYLRTRSQPSHNVMALELV